MTKKNETYTQLTEQDIDYILVQTTDAGPFAEDLWFIVVGGGELWRIPQTDPTFLDWLDGFADVNMEQCIRSLSCTENRLFILHRGDSFPVLSERVKSELKDRLTHFLFDNFGGSNPTLQNIAEEIFEEYGRDSRYYHNLDHILSCLWELDRIPDDNIDKVSIELAVWYHDIVYKPLSSDNEMHSAERLLKDLGDFETALDLPQIYEMILATDYKHPAQNRELTISEQHFLDIDCSVLGEREIEYWVYRQNVRREYAAVPRVLFRLKRKAFLTDIMTNSIFYTKWFKERYEERARKNITKELSAWSYRILPTGIFGVLRKLGRMWSR